MSATRAESALCVSFLSWHCRYWLLWVMPVVVAGYVLLSRPCRSRLAGLHRIKSRCLFTNEFAIDEEDA